MHESPEIKDAENGPSADEDRQWLGAKLQQTLDTIYEKYRDVDDGALATYIPELGKANPNDFGICVATT